MVVMEDEIAEDGSRDQSCKSKDIGDGVDVFVEREKAGLGREWRGTVPAIRNGEWEECSRALRLRLLGEEGIEEGIVVDGKTACKGVDTRSTFRIR